MVYEGDGLHDGSHEVGWIVDAGGWRVLGCLVGPGGRGGRHQPGLPSLHNDYGGGQPSGGPRSLMEVFNRVSSAGGLCCQECPMHPRCHQAKALGNGEAAPRDQGGAQSGVSQLSPGEELEKVVFTRPVGELPAVVLKMVVGVIQGPPGGFHGGGGFPGGHPQNSFPGRPPGAGPPGGDLPRGGEPGSICWHSGMVGRLDGSTRISAGGGVAKSSRS